jgi:hypothetical protein
MTLMTPDGPSRATATPTGRAQTEESFTTKPVMKSSYSPVGPIAVEEERVFPEQVVELWNHGVVVGNGPGFELPQSALDLCGREFHCTLLSIGSPQGDEPCDIALCEASHPLSSHPAV